MKWTFLSEAETGTTFTCAMCGKTLEDGYSLNSQSSEEDKILKQTFGNEEFWFVGECCFGGYCMRPNKFLQVITKKLYSR